MVNLSGRLSIKARTLLEFIEAVPHPDDDTIRRFAVKNGLSREHVTNLVAERYSEPVRFQ